MRCNRNNLIYYYCHKILFKLENEFFKLLHFLLVFLDYYKKLKVWLFYFQLLVKIKSTTNIYKKESKKLDF